MFGQKLEKKHQLKEGIPLMLTNFLSWGSEVAFRFKLKEKVPKNMVTQSLLSKCKIAAKIFQ